MPKYTRKSKAEIRQRRIRNFVVMISMTAVVLTGAVLYFRQQVKDNFAAENKKEVQSAQVTIGSIKTTVSGSGNLTSEGIQNIESPIKVKLEDILVEAGDPVEAGQLVAVTNNPSVLSCLQELQSELKSIDNDIQSASKDKVSSYISAGVTGRVKAIFVEPGDDVSASVAEHGALILLSLDGYMAAEIPAGNLSVGDTVEVVASSGTSYDGKVSAITGDLATILVTDNGTVYQDTVTIGKETGKLFIHQPLKVTGYAGTIQSVNTRENAQVSSSTGLLTLTNTDYSAGYEQLLAERAEMENVYQALVQMYQDGGIRVQTDGTIQSILEISNSMDTTEYSTLDMQTIMTLDPNETVSVTISVDETNIQSLDVGQEASITIASVGEDVFTGTVSEIDKTATSSGGVTLYTATITLDKTKSMLSGMTADVDITIEGIENTMLVPVDAVRKTSATSYVYTSYDEETGDLGDMVEVITGLSNKSYIEIISGLKEGDTVYYTEKENVGSFGGFNFGGGMGGIPSGGPSGGSAGPSFGGGSAGPSFGGGSGGRSGGMPSGGGMPGGRG